MTKLIKGTVTFQDIEGGFWGIFDNAGERWLILDMPEQLKFDGKKVEVTLDPIDAMSMMMWGTPAKVVSFST